VFLKRDRSGTRDRSARQRLVGDARFLRNMRATEWPIPGGTPYDVNGDKITVYYPSDGMMAQYSNRTINSDDSLQGDMGNLQLQEEVTGSVIAFGVYERESSPSYASFCKLADRLI
jgi:hypothetical protein